MDSQYYPDSYHNQKPAQLEWGVHSASVLPLDALIKPSRKRYLILFLFILLNILKSFQWICLASITNLVATYYQVENMAVNWTCVLFMITFLVLALPSTFIMEHIGLRNSMLIGSIGTTLGALVKCFACHRDGFMLGMLGHLLIGFAEPFFFSAYSRVAAVWFPDNQVSLATATALLGDPLGTALGFIVPVMLVGSDVGDIDGIGRGLLLMSLGMAGALVLNTLLVVFFFDEQPPFAPGIARYKQIQLEKETKPKTFRSHLINQLALLREFMSNRHFLQLFISFGINAGTNYSLHTLLNQMIMGLTTASSATMAPDAIDQSSGQSAAGGVATFESEIVGNTGLILTLVGLLGSLACGYILDRYHRYKTTTLFVYLSCTISMALLTVCLPLNRSQALYLAALPLGFFMTGYSSCAFEYAVEITYPRPELVSSTLLNVSAQIFGIPISFLGSAIVDQYGGVALGVSLALVLLVGALLTCLQGGHQQRQQAVAGVGQVNKLHRLQDC